MINEDKISHHGANKFPLPTLSVEDPTATGNTTRGAPSLAPSTVAVSGVPTSESEPPVSVDPVVTAAPQSSSRVTRSGRISHFPEKTYRDYVVPN